MARFFFHLRIGDHLFEDDEGTDLPEAMLAREEALKGARELWADAIMARREPLADAFVIADEQGHQIMVVPLIEALPGIDRLMSVAGLNPHRGRFWN